MFNRLSSVLQQAVGTFGPGLPRETQFITSWQTITKHFVEKKACKVAIEQTELPRCLGMMLRNLIEEEMTGTEPNVTGPCMEYLLQHDILDVLYCLAKVDRPPGLKQMILRFFSKLLSRSRQPLLPHISVYKSVQRMVNICGEVKASPYESEEVEFLCVICSKVAAQPFLVSFFMEKQTIPEELNCNEPKNSTEDTSNKLDEVVEVKKIRFSLVDCLLRLVQSEDARVSVKACEGLMLIASLPEERSAEQFIESTSAISQLTDTLCSLYQKLPKVLEPGNIELVEAKWGLDMTSSIDDCHGFSGKRQLVAFLSWLDFCDQLITVAHPKITASLASRIKSSLLEALLLPSVLQTCEAVAITSTALLNRCLRLVSSKHLLNEFVYCILGDDLQPEDPLASPSRHKLRQRLIERTDHISEELCLVTWRTFELLLSKRHHHVMMNLVLRNIRSRNYLTVRDKIKTTCCVNKDANQTEQCSHDDNTSSPDIKEPASSTTCDNNSSVEESAATCSSEKQSDYVECRTPGTDIQGPSAAECHTPGTDIQGPSAAVLDGNKNSSGALEDNKSAVDGDDVKQVDVQIKDLFTVEMEKLLSEVVKQRPSAPSDKSTGGDKMQCKQKPSSTKSFERIEVEKSYLCRRVTRFLELIPSSVKTADFSFDRGYSLYLKDTRKHLRQLLNNTTRLSSCDCVSEPDSDSDQFYEGSFLSVLFNKLSHLLDQSYQISVQVTQVAAQLVLLSHPIIDEYFLNTDIQLKTGCRSLYSILLKVSTDVDSRLKSMTDLSQRMSLVRQCLMKDAANIRQLPDQQLLSGVVVLEEFCKELAAVCFVKCHSCDSQQ